MTVDQTSYVVINETLSAVGNPTARKMYTKTDIDNAFSFKADLSYVVSQIGGTKHMLILR